ncbi:MAG: PH domain-containing protein [bacterium]|nr:PH domain-containing protein [bacterium]MDE0234360.1 PH domain-containing protein [bacterium]
MGTETPGKDGWAIPAILVVTEEHAILKTKKEQRVIPLEKISAVTTKTGFFNKLVVQTSGEAIEMKNIALKKPELEHLGLVLQGFA